MAIESWQETTYKGYTVETDDQGVHIIGDNILLPTEGSQRYEKISLDLAIAIHRAVAKLEPCSDDSCPCYRAGHEQAVETVGEWRVPYR